MYDISVIIPIYNVEEYLTQCLESILKLTKLVKAEVLLVDDDSTDRSGAIAKEYAEQNADFVYYKREKNGGLSAARNFGAEHASGRYLLFIDSDDYIIPAVYAEMMRIADRDHSDFAVCRHIRIKDDKKMASNMCVRCYYRLEDSITNIRNHPNFVYSPTIWDKLIRRSFYEENGIHFPVDRVFEDSPTTLMMFMCAERVSVCWKTGYFWRIRSGSNQSITQNTTNLDYYKDKFWSFSRCMEVADQFEDERVKDYLRYKLMTDCLNSVVFIPPTQPKEISDLFVDIAADFMESIENEKVITQLPAIFHQFYHGYKKRDAEALFRLVSFYKDGYSMLPFHYDRPEVYMCFPSSITGQEEYAVNNDVRDFPPSMRIREVKTEGSKVHMYGRLFRERVQACEEYPQNYKAMLIEGGSNTKYIFDTEPFETQDLTECYGGMFCKDGDDAFQYNYDLSGFHFCIDLESIANNDSIMGDCPLLLYHKSVLEEGTQIVSGPTGNVKADIKQIRYSANHCNISFIMDKSGVFFLRKEAAKAKEKKKQKLTRRMVRFLRKQFS